MGKLRPTALGPTAAGLVGLFVFLVSSSPTGALTIGPEGKPTAVVRFNADFETTGPTVITATVDPPQATGTVVFKLDGTAIGPPVALVGGRAESPPVVLPQRRSFGILVEYSGDAIYAGSASTLHKDWSPEEAVTPPATLTSAPPVGATPAAGKARTLARTGGEPALLIAAAVLLVITGTVTSTAGRRRRAAGDS